MGNKKNKLKRSRLKHIKTARANAKRTNSMRKTADSVVLPQEVEISKAKTAEAAGGARSGDTSGSHSLETPVKEATIRPKSNIALGNMIQVPDNCQDSKMDENGVCREVF